MKHLTQWAARIGVGVLVGAMFTTSAWAAARDDLNSFTKGLKGLNATFTQQVFNDKGRLKESSSGKLALSAPRLFRWEYVKPYPQLIVADGRKVWVYDPDLQQATVKPQGPEEQNSPLAALIDPAKLDAQFVVKDAGAADGMNWLTLAPRHDEAGFRTARLGFAKGELSKMVIVDTLGQRTEIRFSGWKRNPAFARGTFNYKPAKGVDVIGEG